MINTVASYKDNMQIIHNQVEKILKDNNVDLSVGMIEVDKNTGAVSQKNNILPPLNGATYTRIENQSEPELKTTTESKVEVLDLTNINFNRLVNTRTDQENKKSSIEIANEIKDIYLKNINETISAIKNINIANSSRPGVIAIDSKALDLIAKSCKNATNIANIYILTTDLIAVKTNLEFNQELWMSRDKDSLKIGKAIAKIEIDDKTIASDYNILAHKLKNLSLINVKEEATNNMLDKIVNSVDKAMIDESSRLKLEAAMTDKSKAPELSRELLNNMKNVSTVRDLPENEFQSLVKKILNQKFSGIGGLNDKEKIIVLDIFNKEFHVPFYKNFNQNLIKKQNALNDAIHIETIFSKQAIEEFAAKITDPKEKKEVIKNSLEMTKEILTFMHRMERFEKNFNSLPRAQQTDALKKELGVFKKAKEDLIDRFKNNKTFADIFIPSKVKMTEIESIFSKLNTDLKKSNNAIEKLTNKDLSIFGKVMKFLSALNPLSGIKIKLIQASNYLYTDSTAKKLAKSEKDLVAVKAGGISAVVPQSWIGKIFDKMKDVASKTFGKVKNVFKRTPEAKKIKTLGLEKKALEKDVKTIASFQKSLSSLITKNNKGEATGIDNDKVKELIGSKASYEFKTGAGDKELTIILALDAKNAGKYNVTMKEGKNSESKELTFDSLKELTFDSLQEIGQILDERKNEHTGEINTINSELKKSGKSEKNTESSSEKPSAKLTSATSTTTTKVQEKK